MVVDDMSFEFDQPFLTIAPVRDSRGRRILLLHADSLVANAPTPATVSATLARIRPCAADALVYLHGGVGTLCETTTLAMARRFRAMLDAHMAPEHVPGVVYALHVSFVTRAHAAVVSRFAAAPTRALYDSMVYCDLLVDLEEHLGIDCTLLGLRSIDLHYDEVMRCWVGRKHEPRNNTTTAVSGKGHRRDNLSSGSLSSLASYSTQASASQDVFYDNDDITPVFQHDNHIAAHHKSSFHTHTRRGSAPPQAPDPSKPLFDVASLYFDSTPLPPTARSNVPENI